MNRALFIDRDDTIIRDPGYLSNVNQIEFFPGVLSRIADIRKQGLYVFIVTNQSGIGRGYFSEEQLTKIHKVLLKLMSDAGADVDDIAYCPLCPDDKNNRRKPKPTMIFELAGKYNIDLEASYFVGDKESDIRAGQQAGCKTVLISHNKLIGKIIDGKSGYPPDYIAYEPLDAFDFVLVDCTKSEK